jgi:hypothetical protein
MKADVHSRGLGVKVFSCLSTDLGSATANARNSASLCGIDPDDLEVVPAVDGTVSPALDRFGEEWFVDSEEVRAVAPKMFWGDAKTVSQLS